MHRQRFRAERGFSLLELLVALMVFILLMIAVGNAIEHTLWAEVRDAGRTGSTRSISNLATRLHEEARSSTAAFVPTTDIRGNSNGDGHELDLFRKMSPGGEAFVAYYFDATTGTVTRDEYSPSAGVATIIHSDVIANGIAGFAATRQSAASMPDIVNAGDVQRVAIQYGHPQVTGGNDVIKVLVSSVASGGVPAQTMEIHLATKAAPTSLTVVVPLGAPPSNPPVRVIPFVLLPPARVPLPHGPIHSADPGNPDPTAGMHLPILRGTVTYYGDGTGISWLDLVVIEPTITDGTFYVRSPNGSNLLLVVSCGTTPCPRFVPLPVTDSAQSPPGGVVFQEAN